MDRKLSVLAEAMTLISSSLDLDEALTKITESATNALQAEAGAVLLTEKDKNTLFFKTIFGGGGEKLRKATLNLGEGIAGWVAKENTPLLISDAKKDPRYKFNLEQETGFEVTSVIAVPLFGEGRVIGTLEVTNPKHKKEFEEEDLQFLQLLAPQIVTAIKNAQSYTKLKAEVTLKHNIIGNSPDITKAIRLVEKVSQFDATVLITGESGTGKELIVWAIHEASPRRDGPLIPINCTAFPETLLESELFGHQKGAFTGAILTRKGKFELADTGTLFLDEIGDMSPNVQAKVLRAIEEKSFCPVGSEKEIKVNIRIIAATNKDLPEECKKGRFREDLFYRLNEFRINLPPLRERKEDIPLLAEYFINEFSNQFNKKIKGMDKDVMDLLLASDWPGNVRQLRSTIKQAIIMASTHHISAKDISEEIMKAPSEIDVEPKERVTLEEVEKGHITNILNQTNWKKTEAARILGLSRPTLDAKIAKYKLSTGMPSNPMV